MHFRSPEAEQSLRAMHSNTRGMPSALGIESQLGRSQYSARSTSMVGSWVWLVIQHPEAETGGSPGVPWPTSLVYLAIFSTINTLS